MACHGSAARLPRSPPSRAPRGLARRHPTAASGRSDGEAFGTIGHSISPLTAALRQDHHEHRQCAFQHDRTADPAVGSAGP
ncbi:hypothetical protein BGLA2_990116 [Burkholderia gladioli]|nr:hypothetical protein BGLA2_990116 [Burkholderia gladioli]